MPEMFMIAVMQFDMWNTKCINPVHCSPATMHLSTLLTPAVCVCVFECMCEKCFCTSVCSFVFVCVGVRARTPAYICTCMCVCACMWEYILNQFHHSYCACNVHRVPWAISDIKQTHSLPRSVSHTHKLYAFHCHCPYLCLMHDISWVMHTVDPIIVIHLPISCESRGMFVFAFLE